MLETIERTVQLALEQKPSAQPLPIASISSFFREMFDTVCHSINQIDNQLFEEQPWYREQDRWVKGETRGDSVYIDRSLIGGNVFEKIGANYVAIHGKMPPGLTLQRAGALATDAADRQVEGAEVSFFATGTSFVIHPVNPMVPTVHCNYRYIEMKQADKPSYWWFGGGADLTPAYVFGSDATHFHQVHKQACDRHDLAYYPKFKQSCDNYFKLRHRNEGRGLGGIFFDQLNHLEKETLFAFVKDCAESFSIAYLPIVEQRQYMPFTQAQKHWQEMVRGRYVEFILSSDRGAKFGLESGMVSPQSVYNCMPPLAAWTYDDTPLPNSPESLLTALWQQPRQWA
jgi:coproporphyrinogen III oxidase